AYSRPASDRELGELRKRVTRSRCSNRRCHDGGSWRVSFFGEPTSMKVLEGSFGRAKPRMHGVRVGPQVLRDLAQGPPLELREHEQRSLALVELTEQLLEQANPLRALSLFTRTAGIRGAGVVIPRALLE